MATCTDQGPEMMYELATNRGFMNPFYNRGNMRKEKRG